MLISSDITLEGLLRAALPGSWAMQRTTELATLGDFSEILQYRFLLLDLDDAAFGALEVIETIRRELMLNIAILCLGGDSALRDAARLARADRFFERDAAITVMQQFCSQYDW